MGVELEHHFIGAEQSIDGCFDLIHLGHVRYLQKARSLGDLLVVGLNTDGSVRRLKGPSRPVVGEKSRAEVLAALECVDYVTLFGDATPERLIRRIKPDVLVKGGDWKTKDIVGRKLAKKIIRVQLLPDLSTTSLIDKIRSAQ